MKDVGQGYGKHVETVQEWNMLFRDNGNRFAHPNPLITAGKKPEPLFFAENPRAKISFFQYADDLEARGELSSQAMFNYTNNILIPKSLEKHSKQLNPQDDTVEPINCGDFMRNFGLLKGKPHNNDEEDVTSDSILVDEDIS